MPCHMHAHGLHTCACSCDGWQALNRWVEESTDAMSEVMAIETMREADAIEAELATFNTEVSQSVSQSVSQCARHLQH